MQDVVDKSTDAAVQRAVAALRSGELIALPTETVYGLGADASCETAVKRVFALKGRPATHPLIVHIANANCVAQWAHAMPAAARRLAAEFWPGPLTLVLPKRSEVLSAVTGGQDTVALRVPAHPLAQRVLQQFGGGVVGPSANQYGHISPTQAAHVADEFGQAVAVILDGGPCEVGLESTIVGFDNEQPQLLRWGQLSPTSIDAALAPLKLRLQLPTRPARPMPGSDAKHYAPNMATWQVPGTALPACVQGLQAQDLRVQVIGLGARTRVGSAQIVMPAEPKAYAQRLYAALRQAEAANPDAIVIEQPPQAPAWQAIHDRLRRASLPWPQQRVVTNEI